MITFVNLTPEEEDALRAKLLEGYLLSQSWRNQQGEVYASVNFKLLSKRHVIHNYGAIYVARYQNIANGAISTIFSDVYWSRWYEKDTVFGQAQTAGILEVSGYLNNEQIYKQEWKQKRMSNPALGDMSVDAALAMCKRSLEDKMKNLAKGELNHE